MIHIAPTRSMLADAVAQYLVWKRWTRWVLVFGSHPEDALLADAYRRGAKRFGARIVAEREYKDTGGSRQTDTGLVQTQQQMPVFTQGRPITTCWSRRTRTRCSRAICRTAPGMRGRLRDRPG